MVWLMLIHTAVVKHLNKYSLDMNSLGYRDRENHWTWLLVTPFSYADQRFVSFLLPALSFEIPFSFYTFQ